MLGRMRFRKGFFFLWAGCMTLCLRGAGTLVEYFGTEGLLPEADLKPETLARADLQLDNTPWVPPDYHVHSGAAYASRHLLSLPNCTPRAVEQFPRDLFNQYERSHGVIALHIVVTIYMFLGLAIVCDNFFVPSLEVLSEMLHLQTDVAGATFMAAGSSAPELVTAIIGVFVAKDDVGLSTVVGSAIYNVMFVISVCGLAAGTAFQLNWWPLVRDCVWYLISIGLLVWCIMDEKVTWYESVTCLLAYGFYILVMYFNLSLEKMFVGWCVCCPVAASTLTEQVTVHYEKMENGEAHRNNETTAIIPHKVRDHDNESISSNEEVATEIHKVAPDESLWERPRGRCAYFLWCVSLPLNVAMYLTVPDCRKDKYRKWFMLTFFMSLVWLSALSFLMVWMITIIGFTFNIPDSVMSLTFVAFGVSLPDVVASVIVMKDGLGDMAVSNAVGSNVFDILVCLGIPWTLKTCVLNPGSEVQVYSEGLLYSSLTLLTTVGILLITIHINKWRLDKRVSLFFMTIYILYSILASMYELNIFGYFHPTECAIDY